MGGPMSRNLAKAGHQVVVFDVSAPAMKAAADYSTSATSAREAARAMLPYIARVTAEGVRLNSVVRHMLGLFAGVPGARAFRRHLATAAVRPGAGGEVLEEALSLVADAPLTASVAA